MFHLLIVNAVYMVHQSNVLRSSEELNTWLKCGFNGSETFEDVCNVFHPAISSMRDYMKHIRNIPLISSFFKVHCHQDENIFMVSLIMSLECFETYVNSITTYEGDMSYSSHDNNFLPNKNSETLVAEAVVDEEIPYNIDIKGKHMRNTTMVDRELIEKMYHNAFRVAETGNQGKGLPPPMSRRVTQKKKMDSYLLCEFQDAEDKTYFMKWLPLEDAIEVIIH